MLGILNISTTKTKFVHLRRLVFWFHVEYAKMLGTLFILKEILESYTDKIGAFSIIFSTIPKCFSIQKSAAQFDVLDPCGGLSAV